MSIIHLQKTGSIELDQGLLNQAIGFFNGGSRCIADIKITPLITNSPMAPAIVCFAFSVEMYLKLLSVIATGKYPKDHKLQELFSSLPEEFQKTLITKYVNTSFEADMANVSNAFIEWRYEHEYAALTINPDVLINIASACHTLARELKPSLKVFGEN